MLPFQELLLSAAENLTVAAPWSSPPATASSSRALAAAARASLLAFSHLKKMAFRDIAPSEISNLELILRKVLLRYDPHEKNLAFN